MLATSSGHVLFFHAASGSLSVLILFITFIGDQFVRIFTTCMYDVYGEHIDHCLYHGPLYMLVINQMPVRITTRA